MQDRPWEKGSQYVLHSHNKVLWRYDLGIMSRRNVKYGFLDLKSKAANAMPTFSLPFRFIFSTGDRELSLSLSIHIYIVGESL